VASGRRRAACGVIGASFGHLKARPRRSGYRALHRVTGPVPHTEGDRDQSYRRHRTRRASALCIESLLTRSHRPSPDMRTRPALAALAAGALPLLVSSTLHSVPEDPAAFPKYRVLFLNGLPVLNDTAERWLANGLRGGEHEFLEQPWDAKTSTGAREIGQGDERADDVRFPASHRLTRLLTPLLR
jgi:hypothetical protein